MKKSSIIKSLISLNIFLYIVFLIMDITKRDTENINSQILKYTTILLCFTISLLISGDGVSINDKKILNLALFFTTLADLFLVILNILSLGLIFFMLVQLTYIKRHLKDLKLSNKLILAIFSVYILLLASLYPIKPNYINSPLFFLGITYGVLLITSLLIAFNALKKGIYPKENSILIAIGMFLFFMCDLNVGLMNLLSSYNFYIAFLIWFFYFPSQLLLSLSGYSFKYLKGLFN